MWDQIKRVIKDNGAICIFGSEPFTSNLISSNYKGFKYRLDWNKKIPAGISYAKYRPMQQTEDICIFTKNGEKTNYYPQMIKRNKLIKSGGTKKSESAPIAYKDKNFQKEYKLKNPITLIEFKKIRRGSLHPTQKPVELISYLIRTYTKENELILDFCMGSGTTAVACKKNNRNYIGSEISEEYCKIAEERLKQEYLFY